MIFDDFFGETFDFNNDGETSLDEKFMAYKIFEDCTDDDDDDDNDYDYDYDDDEDDDDYLE